MKFSTTLLILFVLGAGCSKRTNVTEGSITFDFSANLKPASQKRISKAILFQLENLNSKIVSRLGDMSRVKVDSIPFAYILYIPFTDSIKNETKEVFDVLAISLSEDRLQNSPVHIILTDNDFKTLTEFPFYKAKINSAGHYVKTHKTLIEADANVPTLQLGGVEIILESQLNELYKSDEVIVRLKQKDKAITVDITIDATNVNVETLNNQLSQIDPLPWLAIFDGQSFQIQVRDKTSKIILRST